ncbi:MAG: glycosyltransferase [Nitrososphaerota archaeon]|nr:glycosyltransferase [Nitrososphaerota archaeon]
MLVSPDTRSGSYLQIIEQMEMVNLMKSCTLVCLETKGRPSRFRYVIGSSRYPDYEKWGTIMVENQAFALLYNLPLLLASSLSALILRPRIIVANGVISSLGPLLVKPILDCHVILGYHGETSRYVRRSIVRLFRRLLSNRIDFAIANSEGGKSDLSLLVDPHRIEVLKSVLTPVFFAKRDREAIRKKLHVDGKFLVFYAGWLNQEKRCHKLLEAIGGLASKGKFEFYFAGAGALEGEIKKLASGRDDVKFLGFISDSERLAELYNAADLVWGIADTTYLARSGVEALACGTPIFVPLVPGVLKKAQAGVRVPTTLIPKSIGWVIDDEDVDSLRALLTQLSTSSQTDNMREACRTFAEQICHDQAEVYRRTLEGRVYRMSVRGRFA